MVAVTDWLRDAVGPTLTGSPVRTQVTLSALLTAVIVGLVPVGGVLGAPVRLLLVGGVVLYALAAVAVDAVFEAVAVAFVFVGVFNTRAMPALPAGELRVVSLLGLVTAALLVSRNGVPEGWLRRADRRVVVGGFAVFALWGVVAALAGNGPNRGAAVWYSIEQFRYLCLLVLSALLVREGNAVRVLAPLTFALGATLVFAVDQVFAGTAGYLVNFGTAGFEIARQWPSPPLTAFPRGGTVLYERGAFGQNRTMVGLAIVFVPLVLARAAGSRRDAAVALTAVMGLVSIVASGSHAAIAALYAALAPVALYATTRVFDRAGMDRARRLVVPVSVAVGVVAVVGALAAVASGPQNILFVRTNNLGIRLQQYAAAIDVAVRYPLVGVGGGGRNVGAVTGVGVHNIFLYHLAATGVPGLLSYLVSTGGGTAVCVSRCLTARSGDRWLWVGILGGLLGWYTYAFWTVAWRWELLNATHWLLVGVVVGAEPVDTERLRELLRQ